MKTHHPSHRRPKKEAVFPVAVLSGTVFSVLLGMLLLALSCIPILSLSDPLRFAPVFALISLFVSSAVGAYVAARLHGKSGLACGVLSTLAFILILALTACLLSLKIRTTLFFICAPCLLLISAVAGIKGVSVSEPKAYHHKHAKRKI
jgi:putative membrane protein (TIGR04086 family)